MVRADGRSGAAALVLAASLLAFAGSEAVTPHAHAHGDDGPSEGDPPSVAQQLADLAESEPGLLELPGAGYVRIEEETFHKTLANGERLLSEEIAKASDGVLSGKVVFRLYDTYGFPYELTAEIAQENGLSVHQEEFDEEMRLQKERARAARGELNSMGSQAADLMNFEETSRFVGYDSLSCTGTILALFKDGKRTEEICD